MTADEWYLNWKTACVQGQQPAPHSLRGTQGRQVVGHRNAREEFDDGLSRLGIQSTGGFVQDLRAPCFTGAEPWLALRFPTNTEGRFRSSTARLTRRRCPPDTPRITKPSPTCNRTTWNILELCASDH